MRSSALSIALQVKTMTFEPADPIATLRATLLSAPRAQLAIELLPLPVLAYLKLFEDVLGAEARRLMINGTAFFELLRIYPREDLEFLDEEQQAKEADVPAYFTGTIVDSAGQVVVDLDFERRLATFAPSPQEAEHDAKLSAHAEKLFTLDNLRARAPLKPYESPIPPNVEHEPDAKGYTFQFAGKRYFATMTEEGDLYEVLIFDAAGRGLGGSYSVGDEPFDVAEVEVTGPLTQIPASVRTVANAHDAFETKAKPKVVF